MVAIISHPDDVHTQAVRAELDGLGVASAVVDLSQFPGRARLRADYATGRPARVELDLPDGTLDLGACQSVWWRRPQPFGLDGVAGGADTRFAENECMEAFDGLWHALDAFWINPPLLDEAAHKKTYGLAVAAEVGLDLPRTLVTNDPDAARAFVDAQPGGVVYKPFSATSEEWRETRLVGAEELARLDGVRYAPVIFQEYVPGVDLRVTVVGERVFAAAIDARESSYPADFRMAMDEVRIHPTTLPEPVERGLLAYMRRLGLVYGAADFRLADDGRVVFLEVNPAGQWLFVEVETGQPIARAIAEMLAAPPEQVQRAVAMGGVA